jgi:hypothetical protein
MFSSQMGHLMLNSYLPPTTHLQFYNLPTYQPTHLLKCNTYVPTHPPTHACITYLSICIIYLLIYLPTYLDVQPTYLHINYLPTHLPTHPPKCTTYLFIHPSITYLRINYLPTYLPTYPPTYNLRTY